MLTYKPLTKKIIDENGDQMVVCQLYGTDECRKIHTPSQCLTCPMIQQMLLQLNTFEEVYMESDIDEE